MADAVRFRHKPIEIEAIEAAKVLAAAANGTSDKLPTWVKDALWQKKIEIARTAYAVTVYPNPVTPRVGAARDYITWNGESVNISPPEILRDLYDPVDE